MERLTFVDEKGRVLFTPDSYNSDVGYTIAKLVEDGYIDLLEEIAERLANCEQRLEEYENIGLTPKQLMEVDKLYSEKCKELAELKKGSFSGMELMKKLVGVSETEMKVMEKLWDQGGGIKQSQLLALFEADGKVWKRQTLNTFLSRLETKGLIKRENRLVKPLYSRDEYGSIQIKAMIDWMYGGKLSKFVAAFVKENASKKEVDGMARFIADLVFAEKETVLEALQNDDKEALEEELYYAIQDCGERGKRRKMQGR